MPRGQCRRARRVSGQSFGNPVFRCQALPANINQNRFAFVGSSMTEFTPLTASIGGMLIGIAAVLLRRFLGRIAGISGIFNGALSLGTPDRLWRLTFLMGLIAAGAGYQFVSGEVLITRTGFSLPLLLLAGVLVGFGTRLGSGCTSGHGVCGLSRFSMRSLVATFVFLGVGVLTASALSAFGSAA